MPSREAARGEWGQLPTGTPRALLIAILALATVLRVAALDKPFYVDEIITVDRGLAAARPDG